MSFKPPLIMGFALLAGCSSASAELTQNEMSDVRSEIEQHFDELALAAKNLDHEAYLSFFDPDNFSLLNADGTTIEAFQDFKDIYLTQMQSVREYESLIFDPVTINVLDGNNAVLVNAYTAQLVLSSGDVVSASGAGAQVWHKQSGQWTLVHVSNLSK